MLSTHYQVNVKYSHLHELLLRGVPLQVAKWSTIYFLPFRGQKRMPLLSLNDIELQRGKIGKTVMRQKH